MQRSVKKGWISTVPGNDKKNNIYFQKNRKKEIHITEIKEIGNLQLKEKQRQKDGFEKTNKLNKLVRKIREDTNCNTKNETGYHYKSYRY